MQTTQDWLDELNQRTLPPDVPRQGRPIQASAPTFPDCDHTNVVYAIQGAGLVKIGTTGWLTKRFAALQAASPVPLTVLAYGAGAHQFEGALHAKYAPWRRHGEWFHLTDQLITTLVTDLRRSKLVKTGSNPLSQQRRACKVCGGKFTPTNALRAYCSGQCQRRARGF